MTVLWASPALVDRMATIQALSMEDPAAASRLDRAISKASSEITDTAKQGKAGMIEGTREVPLVDGYHLVFEIRGDAVWVLALVHLERRWPPVID